MMINIGGFKLKEMISILFWMGVGLIICNLIIPFYLEESSSIQRVFNYDIANTFKDLILIFIVGFFRLAIWRISCESIYIVLKGFQSLYRKDKIENEKEL